MAWPWGACWGSGLGPGRGVPVGEVALALGCLLGKVLCLEGLAGFGGFGAFGGFGEFWTVCGLANGSFESLRKPLLWPGPGVPVGEVALALAVGCLLGKWPWPWGACWGRCLEFCFGKFGAFAG